VAVRTGVERGEIEDYHQQNEYTDDESQRQHQSDFAKQIAVLVFTIVSDERHEGEGEWQTKDCADEYRVVVNQRDEETDDEQEDEEQYHARARPLPVVVHFAVDHGLDEERG